MKSLTEVARDLNAIKEERSHPRIAIPSHAQADENRELVTTLLAGTGIEQDQLAGLSLEVAASGLNSIAAVDGGIDGEALMAVIGSLWMDGVVLGARFMRDRNAEALAELYGLLIKRVRNHLEATRAPGVFGHRPDVWIGDEEQFAHAWLEAIRLSASQEAVDGSNGSEPSHGAGSASEERRAAQDDPRSERDQ